MVSFRFSRHLFSYINFLYFFPSVNVVYGKINIVLYCNPDEQPTFLENPHFIKRDAKTKTIHTVNIKKRYKLVYDKRVIHGFTTLSYGIADSTVPYLSLQSEMVTLWRIGIAIRGGLEAIYGSLHIELSI